MKTYSIFGDLVVETDSQFLKPGTYKVYHDDAELREEDDRPMQDVVIVDFDKNLFKKSTVLEIAILVNKKMATLRSVEPTALAG